MRKCKGSLIGALMLLLLTPALLLAQDQQGPQAMRRGQEAPCFKQAGVSDETWQKIMEIHKANHQNVVGICENSSLSAQQKRDQLRQAFRETQKQVHDLLTPQQQDAVKQCRKEHRKSMGGGMGGMRRGGRGGDPCARILRQQNQGQGGPPEGSGPQQ